MGSRGFRESRGGPGGFEDLDVVDPVYLSPPDVPIRGSWRTDAGLVLDRELVVLAGMDARVRLVQARLARRLIDDRAWMQLGFVRLSDYARERLGVAPRTVEEDARVMRALVGLPKLAAALEVGQLTWTRVRALVRGATAENEARLLEASASVDLRELEAFVREFGRAEAAAADDSDIAAAGESRADSPDPAGTIDGLAGCASSGSDETRDAEPQHGSDNADDPALRWGITISRSGRRIWRAACEMASRMAGSVLSPGQVLELVAAEASGGPREASSGAQETSSGTQETAATRWTPPPEAHEQRLRARLRRREEHGRRCLLAFLAETGVAEGFAWLAPASRVPGPAAQLDLLLADLEYTDAFEIDRRLRVLRTAAQRIDYQMAMLLFIGHNRRLFREIGFASMNLYVQSRLSCSERTVWSMLEVVRQSWRHSPLLREAWRDGRISLLAAKALLPVLTETNAEAWIRRAGEVTLRRLEDEVAWALDHGQSPADRRPAPPHPTDDVRADGTGDVDPAELQMRAHGEPAEASMGPAGAVRIECFVPLSVAVMVETVLDGLQRDDEARWQAFERMVARALLEWTAQPRHRDPVFERDGWRCTVPGCSSRRNLHDHHVLFRSHGGGNARDNRTTVCAAHHLHGLHAGVVRATGRSPSEILWELGCARGRRPLMRLRGDRVLERAA